MIIILFVLAGAGKNFVGDILSSQFDFHFWDADELLPEDMRKAIQQKQLFTQEMRDHFTQIIIAKIKTLEGQHQKLVIAQALYKEKNRQEIASVFPQAKWLWIQASTDVISARLRERNDWVDDSFALKIFSQFESPILTHGKIVNNQGRDEVIQQLKKQLQN